MKTKMLICLIILCFNLFLFAEEIVILHTNDHHGRPLASKLSDLPGGGLSARSTLVQKIRSQHKNVLLLDAGDINDGLIESNMFEAEPDIIAYNYLKYDAMTLGNHEFYKSLEKLNKQKSLMNFPLLSANILYKDESYVAKPYIIKTYNDTIKVGIIGLTTNSTKYSAPLAVTNQLIFIDEIEACQKIVDSIKDSTDMIIALVHLGMSEDPEYGSFKLAKYVNGLDLVIDGHSHTYLQKEIWIKNVTETDSIPVVQAACWGAFLGKVKVDVQKDKAHFISWDLIPINASMKGEYMGEYIQEDPELLKILQPYKDKTEQLLGEVIAQSDKKYTTDTVRKSENELATLTLDAMMWYFDSYKPDFAITNGGGIRSQMNQGDIKKSDIYNILPFDNSVTLIELRGKDIKVICEHLLKRKMGTGGFLHFTNNFKLIANPDSTIKQVLLNDKELIDTKTYKVLTNSYLASGGDAYEAFLYGKVIETETLMQREILIEYLQKKLKGIVKLQAKPQIIFNKL